MKIRVPKPLQETVRSTRKCWNSLLTTTRQRLSSEGFPDYLPRGCFSEYEAVRSGRVKGCVLSEEQSLPAPAPHWEMEASGLRQLQFSKWPVFWSNRQDVLLSGTSHIHLDDQGRACWEAMYGPTSYLRDKYWTTLPISKTITLRGSWTSISSQWTTPANFYHWHTDALTRLLLLDRFPPDVGILVHCPTILPGYAVDSLKRLGVWDRVRVVNGRSFKIEDYWFAAPTAVTGCPNPMGIRWLRERMIGPVEEQDHSGPKIFITRRGVGRSLLDAETVEENLRKDGWTVVDPGTLTLEEQIDLFGRCSRIRGLHGAGMTNELWCKSNTLIEECISRRSRNGCYEGMSLSLGHRHRVALMDCDGQSNLIYDSNSFGFESR